MSSYEMMKSELPAYSGQQSTNAPESYQQQPGGGQFMVQALPDGTFPARQVQHHDPPPPRRKSGNDIDDEGASDEDKEITEPGGIPDKALDLEFDKCFYEHKSTKTFRQLHTCLGISYKYTKLVVYHIFVILIGIPLAILWAIINGLMVFILVWLYQPVLRVTVMWIYAVTPLVTVPIQAILTPLVDVSARIFRQIRVKANLEGSFAERLAGRNQTQTV